MIRKTVLGLAAAGTLAITMATSAPTASAGAKVHFHFGAPVYGYSHGYRAPYVYRSPRVDYRACPRVFVGFKKVRTHYGWRKRPIYRRHCGY